MTTQTVPVPVELLRNIKERYPVATGFDYLSALVDLIPALPEVGDKVTAEQMGGLPYLSVAVDNDGDVWVAHDDGDWYMAVDGAESATSATSVYEPYTIVYLPGD